MADALIPVVRQATGGDTTAPVKDNFVGQD